MGLSGVLIALLLVFSSCNPIQIYYDGLTDASHSTAWPAVTPAVEQWRPLVELHFRDSDVDRALCLIGYESGGDPDVRNPDSTAAGLFQFLRATWDNVPVDITGGSYDSFRVYDPEANVKAAAWLQKRYGWTQWSPYNAGFCR